MRSTPLYILMGLLLVSAVFASGAMADSATPVMKPLLSAKSVVSASYAETTIEETEAVSISDMGYGSLQVKPSYAYLQLQPGETGLATVSITNRGDEDINIDPVMLLQPYSENYLEEDWVTVTPSDVVLQPGDKKEFTVEVIIPEDADLGYYSANIVFDRSSITSIDDSMEDSSDAEFAIADSKISSVYYGNSLDLSVEVWIPPTVHVSTNYISDRVQAGEEYDYVIKLVNTGDKDISISPELMSGASSVEILSSYYDPSRTYFDEVFGEDSIVIDSPEKVNAGETAVVNVHLKVPEGITGSYSTTIGLDIDDPALDEWANQVNLYLDVWEQPSDPLVREFSVNSESTVMIELSADRYSYSGYSEASGRSVPSFDVALTSDGEEVKLKLIKTVSSGSVNFGNDNVVIYSDMLYTPSSEYQEYSTTYTEIYEAVGVSGECELSILSHNTDNFEYSITTVGSE
nr:hypothetical protein [uncultured Methanolobus sp.]